MEFRLFCEVVVMLADVAMAIALVKMALDGNGEHFKKRRKHVHR